MLALLRSPCSYFNLPSPLTWLVNFFHCSLFLHYLSNCCFYCRSHLLLSLGDYLMRLIKCSLVSSDCKLTFNCCRFSWYGTLTRFSALLLPQIPISLGTAALNTRERISFSQSVICITDYKTSTSTLVLFESLLKKKSHKWQKQQLQKSIWGTITAGT